MEDIGWVEFLPENFEVWEASFGVAGWTALNCKNHISKSASELFLVK